MPWRPSRDHRRGDRHPRACWTRASMSSSAIPAARCCRSTTRCSSRTKLRHILVRQEGGAVHAAEGYARSTGKVGVVLVTSGPGATNAVTGLTDALMDSVPDRLPHRPGADAPDRHRRVPGGRHGRHHARLHQAQLPGEGRRSDLARVLHEAFYVATQRPAGPGRRRHAEGRAVRRRRPIAAPRNVRHRTLSTAAQGRPRQDRRQPWS